MSSVPVICPNCYRSIPAPVVGSDGQVCCDVCRHSFPPGGAMPSSPVPSSPLPSYTAPPPYKPAQSFQPISSTMPAPPTKYQPAYPPAGGPQSTGNPGMVACGMIALFGVMGLACCGALGVVFYGLADQQIANQPNNAPNRFNPPINFPQQVNPPNNNPGVPPGFPQSGLPAIPEPVFPDVPQPVIPEFPRIESSDPFEPVPGIGIPGTPAPPPAPKTLDDFLQAMKTIDPANFTARQLLEELNRLPVEEGRRAEVIDGLLELLGRAGIHASGLLAGPAQTTLENWMTQAESTKVAQFAAGDTNHFTRRHLLQQLAKVGGDKETAKALLPLLKDPVSTFKLPEVFEKIGAEAEEPLLSQVDDANTTARSAIYNTLGKIGGKKSAEKLQARINSGEGFDRVFGGKALAEIKSRGADK